MFVARFNENGTLDAGFNGGIVANANAGRDASALLIQPGDKIDPLIGVARFHGTTTTGADGALDTSFGTNGAPGQRVGRRAHVVERNGRPGQEEAQRHSR